MSPLAGTLLLGGAALLAVAYVSGAEAAPAAAAAPGTDANGRIDQATCLNIIAQVNAETGLGLDPGDVLSVITIESSFRPGARGAAGEIGLMQIMPATAAQFGYSPDQLADPAQNIRCGMIYLGWCWDYLAQHFGRNPTTAEWLSAYNGGVGRAVQGWKSLAYVARFDIARASVGVA